jgi:hypothetical protein
MKHIILAALLPCTLVAQTPPNVDPSQVQSGYTAAGYYDYTLKDGTESRGSVFSRVDSQTGTGVIFTTTEHGDSSTTLVSPGLSTTTTY